MHEQSKSAKRRYYDGDFMSKYFVGDGLDVGCGDDSVGQYTNIFPLMNSVTPWDLKDGDAQYLKSVKDGTFDFVHSSHSLEHMADPYVALTNWARVLKDDGYLIITIPDEDLYEHGIWPSRYNGDHKWSFTICKEKSTMPKSINVVDLVKKFSDQLICIKIQLIDDFYRSDLPPYDDQTMRDNAECSIEVILKRVK